MTNPLLSLNYESAIESLGDEYYDIVQAAQFPEQILRFRNDSVLPLLGLDPQKVSIIGQQQAWIYISHSPLYSLQSYFINYLKFINVLIILSSVLKD